VIEADPVAARVRDIMADRTRWTGQASDLLRGGADASVWTGTAGWPTSPRALAGRLRRAQTSLRTVGIEIAFSREGRTGTRIIRISAAPGDPYRQTVSTVGAVADDGAESEHLSPDCELIGQAPWMTRRLAADRSGGPNAA
jgi:hypothetical protein